MCVFIFIQTRKRIYRSIVTASISVAQLCTRKNACPLNSVLSLDVAMSVIEHIKNDPPTSPKSPFYLPLLCHHASTLDPSYMTSFTEGPQKSSPFINFIQCFTNQSLNIGYLLLLYFSFNHFQNFSISPAF